MAKTISKADRIRQLARHGFPNAAIVTSITKEFGYVNPAYVRAVTGQRMEGSSKADMTWHHKFLKKHGCWQNTWRRRNDDNYRKRNNAYGRAYYRRQREAVNA